MASPNKETAVQPVPVPQDEVGSVQSGEYLIHVYVEETRALRHPVHEDETVDPIIQVTAFGKKRLSKAKSKVGSGGTFWGEHFFFEKNFQTKYEVESQRVTISIMDHNSIGPNALIGSVELSLSAVYMKEKHCILFQWAALAGLTKNFQKVLGFLKFSIGVFGPGDKQITLEQEKALDANTNTKSLQVLYPPQITTQPYQLCVKVFRGEQLKKMDTFGQTDPYVKVEYGSSIVDSSIKKVTLEPVWCEDLLVPLSMPTINNRLVVKLIDWEQVQAHEILGSTIFNIEEIKAGKYKNPFWANIYGSHTGAKSDWASIMNSVPETATEWKGRVQLAIRLEENDHPELRCVPTKDTKTVEVANRIQRENFELRAEIHVAFNLPKNGVKYHVKIRWGKSEVTSKKRESKDRLIEVYESLAINEQFPVGPLGNEEVPDIFVYLNDGDKDFSFIRLKVSQVNDPTVKTKSIFFQNDKSMTNKRDDLAGVVKMRVYAGKAGQNKPLLSQYGWDRPVEKRVANQAWKIQLNIYQARNIISGDSTGTSDPYLNVYFSGYENKTTVINNTTNPIWNERLEFSGFFNTVDEAAPFMITLWDEDVGSLGDDFLGSAIINVTQKCLNPEEIPKPEWLTFRYGKDGRKAGELLYSLCCYTQANLIPRSPYIEPDMQKYFINMKILGLRSLESAGLLPVKKAFVRFDIDSLKRRQEKSSLPEKKALRTEPLDPGSNPNILTVINVEANLPIDPDYCPAMTCSVFDYIFKGASQPLIGNFAIPLGDFVEQTKVELERRVEILTAYYRAKQSEKALGRDDTTQIKEEEVPKDEDEPLNPAEEQEVELVVDSEAQAGPQKTVEELLKSQDPVERAKASRRFIVLPKIDKNGFEITPPDVDKYVVLGHNKKDKTTVKHYRYLVPQELEKSGLIDASPFAKIPIYRGKSTLDEGFFSKLFSKSEEQKVVGYYKAMINVMSENDKMRFDSKIAAVSQIANTKRFEFSDEEFLRRRDVIVRLYIIEAEGLPDRDDDSNSDPYLIVQLGDTKFNESKDYQLDCSDPKFYKCYEFSTSLPGASQLKIQLWDHDDLDADDLIGETSIDLEDRWYSTTWRSLKYVPVETRELFDPSSSIPKGRVKLWVEILPRDSKRGPVWALAPKPSLEFELRVVVWECKNVPRVDIEDAVDIYVSATLADGQEQRTDTHFRSTNGKGSFNWRMIFPVNLPVKKNRISFQLWDKDLLNKNDYISEASFDFDSFAERAFEKEEIVNVTQGKDTNFWLPCTTTEVVDGKNVTTNKGEVLVSMMIVPKRVAQLSPAGHGRSNPNQNPYLPPPVGRIHFSWNPIEMIEQFIGPTARRTVCIVCCVIFAIFVVLMTLPSFFAAELADLV